MKKILVLILVILLSFNMVQVKKEFSFFDNTIMAHAMGGLEDKYIYNNTEEALKNTIDSNYKIIEFDVILTKDNKLVCSHGWTKQTYKDTGVKYCKSNPVMTFNKFLNTKIHGKYTTMSFATMVEHMKKNPSILWEIDLRTLDYETSRRTMTEILKVLKMKKANYLLDQCLIQVGSYNMWLGIESVVHCKHYQMFFHKADLKNIDDFIYTCKRTKMISVAINDRYIDASLIKKFKENDLKILVHTVDDIKRANELIDMGVDTICTNFITPSDWDMQQNKDN